MLKRIIFCVLVTALLILAVCLFVPKSFGSILYADNKQLRLMVQTLPQQKEVAFCGQTSESTKRITDLLSQYKYIRVWDLDGSSPYKDGKLIFLIFYNDSAVSTLQFISDGKIIINIDGRDKYYISIGGRKLFNELYNLIEAS